LKFLAVAEKTAKDARGLLYFAAPCILSDSVKLYALHAISIVLMATV